MSVTRFPANNCQSARALIRRCANIKILMLAREIVPGEQAQNLRGEKLQAGVIPFDQNLASVGYKVFENVVRDLVLTLRGEPCCQRKEL